MWRAETQVLVPTLYLRRRVRPGVTLNSESFTAPAPVFAGSLTVEVNEGEPRLHVDAAAAGTIIEIYDDAGQKAHIAHASGGGGSLIISPNDATHLLLGLGFHEVWVGSEGTSLVGFFGVSPKNRPTVSGDRSAGTALTSLLTQLDSLGIINDTTVA